MTRNAYDDNMTLWAAALNGLLNADNLELVKSGCTPSKGTGDWDVDIASGTIIAGQSNGEVSVSAQTVTLTDPTNDADMDSGESRIDLVTINSSGTASATEGTAASNPTSPDIPSGEVLVAFVHIDNSDSTITDSTLFDPRVIYGPSAYPFDSNDLASGSVGSAEHGSVASDDHHTKYSHTTVASGTVDDSITSASIEWSADAANNEYSIQFINDDGSSTGGNMLTESEQSTPRGVHFSFSDASNDIKSFEVISI